MCRDLLAAGYTDYVALVVPFRDGRRTFISWALWRACRRALAAAKGAILGMRQWNAERDQSIRVGVGLHLGDVTYGNIGAQRRLDFTVIGAAVNEVSRVESLCKELGRSLLVTDVFAALVACPDLVPLGAHALRGVAAPRAIDGVEGY